MTPIQQHRQQFPCLANKTYFNFGGQGPMPQAVLEEIFQSYQYSQEHGPFSEKINAWVDKKVTETREVIANELGSPVEAMTLTENVTAGCNIALWGLDWQPGEHILMTDCEHYGVIAAVSEICRRFGVEVSTCPILATRNEGDPAAVIAQHLRPKTRLLVLSHLLWNTGQLLPLPEIIQTCRNYQGEKPIQILVDAAQSVGCIPLNLTELAADFYAFTGHKWFCGPGGVGGLYVHPEAKETLHPTFIGWRSVYKNEFAQPIGWKADGRRYEVATSAYAQYMGLKKAITIHSSWGTPQERYEEICQLSKYLWESLKKLAGVTCLLSSPPQAGLVSFQLNGSLSHKKAVLILEQQGFMLRTLDDPNCIRACVHYFTLPEEIERLVEAVDKLSS